MCLIDSLYKDASIILKDVIFPQKISYSSICHFSYCQSIFVNFVEIVNIETLYETNPTLNHFTKFGIGTRTNNKDNMQVKAENNNCIGNNDNDYVNGDRKRWWTIKGLGSLFNGEIIKQITISCPFL